MEGGTDGGAEGGDGKEGADHGGEVKGATEARERGEGAAERGAAGNVSRRAIFLLR